MALEPQSILAFIVVSVVYLVVMAIANRKQPKEE